MIIIYDDVDDNVVDDGDDFVDDDDVVDDDFVDDDVVDDDDYNHYHHDFSGKVRRLLHHHQCLCPGQNSQVRNLKPKMTNGAKCFFQPFLPLHHGGHHAGDVDDDGHHAGDVGDDADVEQVQREGVGGKESDQQL